MKLDVEFVPASIVVTIYFEDEFYELGTIFYNPQREKPYYTIAQDGQTYYFYAYQFAYCFLFRQFKAN